MIIEIKTLNNGGHRNQSTTPQNIPEGWAIVPDDMETPNFPFGEIEVEEIDGVMTVTKWVAGIIPEPTPIPVPEASTDDIVNALLGVNE